MFSLMIVSASNCRHVRTEQLRNDSANVITYTWYSLSHASNMRVSISTWGVRQDDVAY